MSDEAALLVADVFEAAGALRRWGEGVAAAEGQTQARWQVLSVISDAPRTVPSVARRLGISRQAVQRTADALVDDGLARVAANPDHRTSGLLELTDPGRDVLTRMATRAAAAHREVFGTIPDADLARARDVLRRVVTEVRGTGSGPS